MQNEQGGHLSALLVFIMGARHHTLYCLTLRHCRAIPFGEPG